MVPRIPEIEEINVIAVREFSVCAAKIDNFANQLQVRSILLTILSNMAHTLFALLQSWPRFSQMLEEKCLPEWIIPQRIHSLRSFPDTWILREDESGFGMSGSKRRKMASIIPWLLKEKVEQVAIIGGANSNHVVTAIQACCERGIRPVVFLLQGREGPKKGNAFLTNLLLGEDDIHWISRSEWNNVEEMAGKWANSQAVKTMVLPEGGACSAALPGAASLPLTWADETGRCPYNHVWMDSGTGISAIAAMLMCGKLGWDLSVQIVMMAGDEGFFENQLAKTQQWWEEVFRETAPIPCSYELHVPPTAKSFGSVNATVWAEVKRMGKEEGILADPVYTAKLLLTVRHKKRSMEGRHLVVHGGGGVGLLGFSG